MDVGRVLRFLGTSGRNELLKVSGRIWDGTQLYSPQSPKPLTLSLGFRDEGLNLDLHNFRV